MKALHLFMENYFCEWTYEHLKITLSPTRIQVLTFMQDFRWVSSVFIISFFSPYRVCSKLWTLREKCPNTEFFLVRIFPHSDWIRRDTSYLSVSSPNARKYRPGKTSYVNTFHTVQKLITLLFNWFVWSNVFYQTVWLRVSVIELKRKSEIGLSFSLSVY